MAERDRGGPWIAAFTVACITGTAAFAVYSRTLLPGVDLGDTGGFQAAVLWPETSARQGYPLYYFLARPFVLAVSASAPARGLNLFSSLCAAAAVALLTFVSARVTRSALAGAAAGLLLAFSYTFWSQAIIAEVYALHLTLVALCLLALHEYATRPTTARLALFFAVYALSFGNHLTTILLLVPFAVFLLRVHPRPRALVRPKTIALACAIAVAGALLYLPNLLFVWTNIDAPAAWSDRLAAFWFDTTKEDLRAATILAVDASELPERGAMWIWDARQQFGLAGLVLALIGVIRLAISAAPWALLVCLAYGMSTVFAVAFNVGDPHVFFLLSHFLTAFSAGAAVAPWRPVKGRPTSGFRRTGLYGPPVLATAILVYAGWRAWDTWPAADRREDRRADALVARTAGGLDESRAVLLSRMDWQSENALLYSVRYERTDLAWTRLADVMPHLPFFIRDNHAIGRDIVLTTGAAADVLAAYGPLYPLVQDEIPAAPSLAETAAAIPIGTPYVLSLLPPTREEPLDEQDFNAALTTLAGTAAPDRGNERYQVWIGLAGEQPAYHHVSMRPFRESFSLLGDRITVRMDAWVPFDTFRRGGFGHVLRGRDHLLTVERGASLMWLNRDGSSTTAYAGGLYAMKPRFRIPASGTRFANNNAASTAAGLQ